MVGWDMPVLTKVFLATPFILTVSRTPDSLLELAEDTSEARPAGETVDDREKAKAGSTLERLVP